MDGEFGISSDEGDIAQMSIISELVKAAEEALVVCIA